MRDSSQANALKRAFAAALFTAAVMFSCSEHEIFVPVPPRIDGAETSILIVSELGEAKSARVIDLRAPAVERFTAPVGSAVTAFQYLHGVEELQVTPGPLALQVGTR